MQRPNLLTYLISHTVRLCSAGSEGPVLQLVAKDYARQSPRHSVEIFERASTGLVPGMCGCAYVIPPYVYDHMPPLRRERQEEELVSSAARTLVLANHKQRSITPPFHPPY